MNSNDLTLSQKQLPSSVDPQYALTKWGQQYCDFLQKYPPGGNQDLKLINAARRGGWSISRLDKLFGEGSMLYWLKCQLIQLFEYLGLFKAVTEYQVKTIAERILARYFYLTPAELSVFFTRFSDGDYALFKEKGTVNPQMLMVSMPHFIADVQAARAQAENEKNVKQAEQMKQKFLASEHKSIEDNKKRIAAIENKVESSNFINNGQTN